jgi:adenylate cyclase
VWGGWPLREVVVPPGGQFQIGRTVFDFVAGRSGGTVERTAHNQETVDVQEITLTSDELEHAAFGDPIRQLDLICTLPEMIASALSDIELARLLAELLLEAIPESVAVSAAQFDSEVVSALWEGILFEHCGLSRPTTMRTCTREDFEGRFRPSRRLVASSLHSGLSTIQLRGRSAASDTGTANGLDWAFCVPVPGNGQEGWCLYVAGSGGRDGEAMPTHEHLLGNVRFAHVLAQFIGSIRHVKRLQDQKTQLSSYFSPNVVENLTGNQNDVLAPTSREISVLFCDVHGFSRKSEECQDDLQQLLLCVKEALGVMTHGMLSQNGTIADFQGDAALGFWGWPVPLDDGASSACLAALAIQKEFNRAGRDNDLLEDFSIGMGIAHGNAIAGQIGTRQQAKIGVFGPVVNQGSRLEGMTRQFGVSICIDENSGRCVRNLLTPDMARVRKLARVRPKGMETAIDVYELLSPYGADCPISDEHIERFEGALEMVTDGHWTDAIIALSLLPEEGPKKFLVDQMKGFDNTPPADWDGVFSLTSK